MAMNFLSEGTITVRRLGSNGVKLKRLESKLEIKDANVAMKRKRMTEEMKPNKRGRNEKFPKTKQTFVSFDFGPVELNCHRFVSTRLQCILDSGDLDCQLEYGKELLLIHHSGISAGDICERQFGSQPLCVEYQKDGAVPKNTVVMCYVEENLETYELSRELMAHLSRSVERSHLFFLSSENGSTSIERFLEKNKLKVSPNQIITRKAQMSRVYQKMYEDLERNVKNVRKIIDALPQESKIHPIRKKLAYVEKKLKERKKPRRLSENCKRKLKSALEIGVIAYRADSESLTVYINQPRTRSLDAKLRNIEKTCSPLVFRCCRVQTPIYRPHSLRAGCRIENGDIGVLGSIGMFAKTILKNAEKDVAITSAHVICEGCSARTQLDGSDKELGKCIWPPKPTGDSLEANVLDMAVIEMRSGMAENILTSENISIYTGHKSELEFQRVYKRGWKTGETHGDIDIPQFNMFGKTVMVITTGDGGSFSEPGDSGALVLTKKGTHLHALGLIFGGDLKFGDSDDDFPANASIAIYLDDAITRFEEESKRGKIKIQRY